MNAAHGVPRRLFLLSRAEVIYAVFRFGSVACLLALAIMFGRDFFTVDDAVEAATADAAGFLEPVDFADPAWASSPGVDRALNRVVERMGISTLYRRGAFEVVIETPRAGALRRGAPTSWPRYTHTDQIRQAGVVVATVTVSHSLRPPVGTLIGLAVLIGLFFVGSYLFFRRTTTELQRLARDRNQDYRIANQRLSLMLEATGDGFALFDRQERLVMWNHTFARLNSAVAELLREGMTIDEMTGVMTAQMPKLDPHALKLWLGQRRLNLEETGEHRSSYVTPDKRIVETHERRTDDGLMVATLTDITELAAKERALRKSERQLRLVTDALPVVVMTFDRSGWITFANRAASKVSGVPVQDLVGSRWTDHLGSKVVEALRPLIQRAFDGDVVRLEHEGELNGRSGTMDIRIVPHARKDRIDSVFFFAHDVTEQRLLEAQLRHAQKMDSLGQLTGGVAHDFNNLLTVVLGNLDLASDHLPKESPATRAVESAQRGAQRAAVLTQRLLAFSRRQLLRPQEIAVGDLVNGFSDLLRSSLGQQTSVTVNVAEDVPIVSVDPGQLENAVLNLAFNARDAMPYGGEVDITVARETLAERRHLGADDWLEPGDYAAVTVSDNGTGMDEATLARVFEPFFTTKEVGKGSGLGLPMVYGFARQPGGGVHIESTPGRGTAVKLCFPALTASVTRIAPVASPEPDLPRGTEHVLVVEDDPDVFDQLKRTLRGLGYKVTGAPDGETAVDILQADRDFDLIVSDVVLPGVDGGTVVESARALGCTAPVLFITGYAPVRGRSSLRHDNSDILMKPYTREQLATAVRALLDRRPAAAARSAQVNLADA